MKVKAVVFDLDGTLLDTVGDLADASNRVLKQYGFPEHPEESYNYFVGDGLRVLMERATPHNVTDDVVDGCCDAFMEIYRECWHNRTKPYEGVMEMLGALKKRGVYCTVLSNKPHPFTLACVDHFFSEDAFDLVFGQRDAVPKKPDPAGAIELTEKLQVDSRECLYVGDTSVDMKTGKAADMFTVGVTWGFRPKEELISNGADLIVDTPEEIVAYVVSAG